MGKNKLNKKLSKSEFSLICIFFFVAVGVFMITYLLLPSWNRCKLTIERYHLHEQQLNELKSEYLSINDYEAKAATISEELEGLRSSIPCQLSQEEIVLLLDSASAETGLSLLDIFFAGEVSQGHLSFLTDLTQTQHDIDDSSRQSGNWIASERITIKFRGTYDSLIAFLHSFEQSTKHICFRDISLSGNEDGSLSGALSMLVFSISKSDLLFWPEPNSYDAPEAEGSRNPFASYEGDIGADESNPLTGTPYIN